MADFLTVVAELVAGLLALPFPVLGVSYGVVILGLWLFYAVGKMVVNFFFGDDE